MYLFKLQKLLASLNFLRTIKNSSLLKKVVGICCTYIKYFNRNHTFHLKLQCDNSVLTLALEERIFSRIWLPALSLGALWGHTG